MLLALAQSLTDLIAPPVCALCLGDGQRLDEIWGLDLCVHCEQACTPLPGACPRCGEPGSPREPGAQREPGAPRGPGVPGTASECAMCRAHPPPFDTAICLFRYEDPVDLLITNLKFRHELACARVLGMLFARRYARQRPRVAAMPGSRAAACIAVPRARLQPVCGNRAGISRRDCATHRAGACRCAATCCSACAPPVRRANCTAAERAANLAGAFRAPAGRADAAAHRAAGRCHDHGPHGCRGCTGPEGCRLPARGYLGLRPCGQGPR